MDLWKKFAVNVALPGNDALPAANNDLTMGHIAGLGPMLVIILYVDDQLIVWCRILSLVSFTHCTPLPLHSLLFAARFHPRKWFGLTFLPICFLILGTVIPFLPADLGATVHWLRFLPHSNPLILPYYHAQWLVMHGPPAADLSFS